MVTKRGFGWELLLSGKVSFALSAKVVSIIPTSCLLPPLNIPKPLSIKRNFTGRPLVFQIANTKIPQNALILLKKPF